MIAGRANQFAIPNRSYNEEECPMTFANKLTALAVQKAKPDNLKFRTLHDGEGLYLEISKTGRKGWRLKYHLKAGRGVSRSVSIPLSAWKKRGKENDRHGNLSPKALIRWSGENLTNYRKQKTRGTPLKRWRRIFLTSGRVNGLKVIKRGFHTL